MNQNHKIVFYDNSQQNEDSTKILLEEINIKETHKKIIEKLFYDLLLKWCELETIDKKNLFDFVEKLETYNFINDENLFTKLSKTANLNETFNFTKISLRLQDNLLEIVDFIIEKEENFEIKYKILKSLMLVLNKKNQNYEEIKIKIIKDIRQIEIKFYSIYKRSLKDIKILTNGKVFELIFLLHEENLLNYQQKLKKFLAKVKQSFGDFWQLAIKNDMKLLLTIANNINLTKGYQIISNFYDFSQVFFDNFEEISYGLLNTDEKKIMNELNELIERKDVDKLKSLIDQSKHINYKLISYHRKQEHNEYQKSFFEKIASDEIFHDIFKKVWEKFNLWNHFEILFKKNGENKSISDYILDSKSDKQLITFLSFASDKNLRKYSEKNFLVLFSAQLCDRIENQTLIEKIIKLMKNPENNSYLKKLRKVLFIYLEEVGNIRIKNEDSLIENLLSMEKSIEIDEILRYIFSYWTNKKQSISELREKILNLYPHFKLLFLIADDEIETFLNIYHEEIQNFKPFTKDLKKHVKSSIRILNFNLLFIAIKTNRKKIIEFLLQIDSFEDFDTFLPDSKNVNEIHHFTASELMKNRNNINLMNFPDKWVTYKVLKKFLDTKISDFDEEFIELDSRFLKKDQLDEICHDCLDEEAKKFENERFLKNIIDRKRIYSSILHYNNSEFSTLLKCCTVYASLYSLFELCMTIEYIDSNSYFTILSFCFFKYLKLVFRMNLILMMMIVFFTLSIGKNYGMKIFPSIDDILEESYEDIRSGNELNLFNIGYTIFYCYSVFIILKFLMTMGFMDFKGILKESKQKHTIEIANKLIEYNKYIENLSEMNSCLRIIFERLIDDEKFLNIGKFYVQKHTRKIFVIINGEKRSIYKFFGTAVEPRVNEETFQEIYNVLKEKGNES
ncbi:hypothetical protein PVAND_003946 [Polypedilum vanderplanki]|uniref:Uncharacterized protein n=1 Tax=Polypedilum vanderplanki TaxID=319348 RepID=A0A9J6BVN2_POLVA|nr:hypothetical protein PVAND_003946 [Polypedilum vanderplanki]